MVRGVNDHMKRKNGLRRIMKSLDVPDELIMDVTKMTMLGNQQLLIENHRGIVVYTSDLVKVNIHGAMLIVRGCELTLENFQHDQILIEGNIVEIQYQS